jgi:hypothetical protein
MALHRQALILHHLDHLHPLGHHSTPSTPIFDRGCPKQILRWARSILRLLPDVSGSMPTVFQFTDAALMRHTAISIAPVFSFIPSAWSTTAATTHGLFGVIWGPA